MGREEKQNGQVKAAAGEKEEQEQKENELMNECVNEWMNERNCQKEYIWKW